MKRDERLPDQENLLRLVQDDLMSRLRVAMPGIVESVNANGTITVQPALKEPLPVQDGSESLETLPVLPDVPLVQFGAGGITLTLPIEIGDEVLVIFSDRCFDSWFQSGGIQTSTLDRRMHDLSDGFAIPGIRSLVRALANVSTTSAQLRNEDGLAYVELTRMGQINLVGPVNITGALTVNGNVATTGTLKNNTVDVGSDHVHVSGAEGSDTGAPKMGP